MKRKNALFALSSLLLLGGVVASSVSFSPVYAASNSEQDEEFRSRCQSAVDALNLGFDTEKVVADFIVEATGFYGAKFTWTSSNESILSVEQILNENGKALRNRIHVFRPEVDTKVTLTVKAAIANHENAYATRTFLLTVLKAVAIPEDSLPLEINEDFSDYDAGLDLGDYYSYTQSGGEGFLSTIVDSSDENLSNVNDMPSKHVLKVRSSVASSDTRYTRKANVSVALAPSGAYLEGDYLYTGKTNGVGIELLNSSNEIVSGINLSSSGFKQYASGVYTDLQEEAPKEGVWLHFKFLVRPKSGYNVLQVFDRACGSYVTYGTKLGTFIKTSNAGLSSGKKGDVTSFRLVSSKGSAFGYSYLANLKLSLTGSEAPKNYNRSNGIGFIDNYEPEIFAEKSELEPLSSVDPKTFAVHNRFDESKVYAVNSDYTVSTSSRMISETQIEYTHEFVLKETGEKQSIQQNVFIYEEGDKPSFSAMKFGSLRKDGTDKTSGTITFSGLVSRPGATFHYMLLKKGSAAPTIEQVIAGDKVSGFADAGSATLYSRSFSISSNLVSMSNNYDGYAVLYSEKGNSDLVSEQNISTVININTVDDFYAMATDVNTAYDTFRLTNDLDFSSFYWNLKNDAFEFHGKFDGEGHTISNLAIASATAARVGIFSYCYGDFGNVTFENAKIFGSGNAGIIAGNLYGGTYSDIHVLGGEVSVEPTFTGAGEGYFGAIGGRSRGEGKVGTYSNIEIDGFKIECPKYCGLLTGGFESGVISKLDTIYASGTIDTDGAAVGLIGRNRGDTTVNNAIVNLHIKDAKKEVGTIAGHNKEGGKLAVNNAILDLKIDMITQPGYFGSFIGSFDAASSSYTANNVSYIKEDYSHISESIAQDVKSIDAGDAIYKPSTKEAWEQKTFLRDFDVSTSFAYDEEENKPYMRLRNESEIKFVASDYLAYTEKLSETDPSKNHYLLIKAGNVYSYLSSSEKAKVAQAKAKYDACLAAYNEYAKKAGELADGLNLGE